MKGKLRSHTLFTCLVFLLVLSNLSAQETKLTGFTISPHFGEQVLTFGFDPEVSIHINAPSPEQFDKALPVHIAMFALPNGNTTAQTIGKLTTPEDDWHFDIQHIGAQTRFIRQHTDAYNLVIVYLENTQKSWPVWKASQPKHAQLIGEMVDTVRNIFHEYETTVVLTGHSGGGRFTFSYLDGVSEIPTYVKRISFLDSNYGYEEAYGKKIVRWLNASDENVLSVIAYNDSVALYNNKPIVSATGGTWYRSKMMQQYLSAHFSFSKEEDDEFIRYYALDKRIEILLKKNPKREILHTVQVERNGFIQGMLSATKHEEDGYSYFGERAYTEWIQHSNSQTN
ncbi:hypothetical protein V6R21_08970 [Limibacter armeniacum]|uniref:hypothetical protein n=1 Tax=Limibacter armeniacum TaxID=466084 RepID=UPI002FE519DD